MQVTSPMFIPFITPEVFNRSDLWPILIKISDFSRSKLFLVKIVISVAVRIIRILAQTVKIRKISTGRPETMNNEILSIPNILPISNTFIF